jgi:CARDB/SprB repeat
MKYIFITISTFWVHQLLAQTVEQTRQYGYNKNGELTRSEHSNGNVETYIIDPVHNITQWQRVALVADLTIENARLASPGMVTAGEFVTVSFQDKNIGRIAAAGHRYKIYFSQNDVLDAQDPVLANDAVAGLGAGVVNPLSIDVIVPDGTANGVYYLFIRTDADAQIPESDETNNVVRLSLTVRNCAALQVRFQTTTDYCADGKGKLEANPAGGVGTYTYLWRHNPQLPSNTNVLTGLYGGRYYVTVTDENGCQKSDEINLSSGTKLTLTYSREHITCQQSGAIQVQVSGGLPTYQYKWSNGEITPLISVSNAGSYSVTVTDLNECAAQEQNIVIENTCIPTAIHDLTGVTLTVTPNPTDADLTVQIIGATLQKIEIGDALGRRLGKTDLQIGSGEKYVLPFQEQAVGVYFLQFELKDGRKIVRKIVKQ